jgi:hypothetical protein
MDSVSGYIEELPANQKAIILFLDDLLRDFPGVTSKLRYKIPFYYKRSWICYLNPIKKNGVELAFIRGNELSNEQGILDFKQRKQVAGIAIYQLDDLPLPSINQVINEALLLDEMVPYTSKRSF